MKDYKKMEGQRLATGPDPLHFRYWRQPDRFVGKKIMNALSIQQDWLWAICYFLLITLLWPLAVLLISIPFGQFRFFSRYIRKIGAKIGVGRRES
ncbi:MAG: hypothetical protein IPP99_06015 [Chitinophagaceae bacterium]|nr:hypothetical protein [Chitinophagaceae bacterium]